MSLSLPTPPALTEGAYIKKETVYTSYTELADNANTTANKPPTYYEISVNDIKDMKRGDLWVDVSNSTQNMFRYEPNYTGVIAGYYWNGSLWSDYQTEYTATGVDVWIDIDDLKIYQYKTDITVSKNPKTGEFGDIEEAITHLQNTGGTIRIKEGVYTAPSFVTTITLPQQSITIYADATDNVTLKNYVFTAEFTVKYTITFHDLNIVVDLLNNPSAIILFYIRSVFSEGTPVSTDLSLLRLENCTLNIQLDRNISNPATDDSKYLVIDGTHIICNNCTFIGGNRVAFIAGVDIFPLCIFDKNKFIDMGMLVNDSVCFPLFVFYCAAAESSLTTTYIKINNNKFTNISQNILYVYGGATECTFSDNIIENAITDYSKAVYTGRDDDFASLITIDAQTSVAQSSKINICNNSIKLSYNTIVIVPDGNKCYPISVVTILHDTPHDPISPARKTVSILNNTILFVANYTNSPCAPQQDNIHAIMNIMANTCELKDNNISVELEGAHNIPPLLNYGITAIRLRATVASLANNNITITQTGATDSATYYGIDAQDLKLLNIANNKLTVYDPTRTAPLSLSNAKGIILSDTTDSIITGNIVRGYITANAIIPNNNPGNNNNISNNIIVETL